MSLRLERAAAVRWRPLLITPLPPKCKGQCVQSNVMTQVRANRAAAVRKQRSSGRRCRTRSLIVSLEPQWKDASIDTPNTLIRGPWGHQNYFLLNQRITGRRCRTRPPMVSLKPPWKYASKETPHILIRGPWGRRHHFDTHTIFPAKSIGLIEPLPLGIVVIYNTVILSRGRL